MNKSIEDLLVNDRPEAISIAQMGELAVVVNRLLKQQDEIRAMEENLKAAKAQERKLSELEIPELMDNLGYESITLNTGQKVSVKDSVQCSIPASGRAPAYAWLEDNGHGDLIKSAITAKFARGQTELAGEVFAEMARMGASPSQAESVHAGTLKAWAREELANGHALPSEFFKVHIVKQTTVK